MNRLRQILFRLQPFFRRRKIEAELSEEMRAHLEMATEANIAAGMSPEEARLAALRASGGVDQAKEAWRDERGLRWVEDLLRDLRFAARALRKNPGFTLAVVATLAIGLSATTAMSVIAWPSNLGATKLGRPIQAALLTPSKLIGWPPSLRTLHATK